jgi:hypothetical protein
MMALETIQGESLGHSRSTGHFLQIQVDFGFYSPAVEAQPPRSFLIASRQAVNQG